ncbi:MAG: hypothetical protein RIS88_1366 [Pseudomonadota bacterium]|jgi:uncharacterized protein (DUF934 family)
MDFQLQLIAPADHEAQAGVSGVLALAPDAEVAGVALDGVTRIDLQFPGFADGRAFSQAFLLRRRRGYTGEIRATGDVLIDQLVQMQRTGFTSAVLRADQDPAHATRQFARYASYYQGDAVTVLPRFKEVATV